MHQLIVVLACLFSFSLSAMVMDVTGFGKSAGGDGPSRYDVDPDSKQQWESVDIKARAVDYEEAFWTMRANEEGGPIYITLDGGYTVDNVVDLQILPNETAIMVTMMVKKVPETRVINIEEVKSFGQARPRSGQVQLIQN